jgi:hypothetical protein
MVDSYLLEQEQIGGKVDAYTKSGGYSGPIVDPNGTIKMKIELVKPDGDDTLPSYLVPKLECAKATGSTPTTATTASSVMVTLSGNNLLRVTDDSTLKKIKCEITSDFLNGTEKSAITIETYYKDSGGKIVKNTIYFDESLLKSYDNSKKLTITKNPFTAVAAAPGDGSSSDPPSYTFTFDFDTIITEIQALPAYKLIQSMFKVAYGVPSGSGNTSTACLVKIYDNAFLNLNFTGVPFNADNIKSKSDANKLLLSISTTPATGIDTTCDFKDILEDGVNLSENLKKVLELDKYPIDCSKIAFPPSSKTQSGGPPNTAAAAKAAAKAAVSAAADTAAEVVGNISEEDKAAIGDNDIKDVINLAKKLNEAKAKGESNQANTAAAQAALDTKLKDPNLMKKVDTELAKVGISQSVKTALGNVKSLITAKTALFAQAATPTNTDKISNPNTSATGAGVASKELFALQQMIQEAISKYNESIAKLTLQMNQLLSQQGMGGSAQRQMIVQAPGTTGTCSTGDISLTTNNLDTLSVNIPIDKIMSYVIDPSMLERYTKNNLQPAQQLNAGKQLNAEKPGGNVPVSARGEPSGNVQASAGDEPSGNVQASAQQQLLNAQQPGGNVTSNAVGQHSSNAQGGNTTPPVTITISTEKQTELESAIQALASLKPQLTTAGITTDPNAITILNTAIEAAKTAVTAIATAADKTSAEGKITEATNAVAAAETAVEAATIQALTDRLKAAKQKLQGAKDKLIGITPKPSAGVPSNNADDAVAAAETAIGSATDAAKKPGLIKTAETQVTAAEAAVNSFSDAVEAVAGKPAEQSVPDYAAYETAWTAYQEVKGKFDEAAKEVPDAAAQAGEAEPTNEQKAAKTELTKQVDSIKASLSTKYTSIIELTNDQFTGLTDANAKQQQIDNLNAATAAYTDALSKIQAPQAEYDAAIKPKSAGKSGTEPTEAVEDASSAETIQTYTQYYKTIKDCLVVDEGNSPKINPSIGQNIMVKLRDCFDDNKFKDVDMSKFFNAVQVASLNSKAKEFGPGKFNEFYNADQEGGKINYELLLVIISSLVPKQINSYTDTDVNKTSFAKLIESLTTMLSSDGSQLIEKIKEKFNREAVGFSLFDGGSTKAKSASKSSSSSSKSKSKPKNKTKKNHSAPKSSKSKTPKIIMNE